MSKAIYIATIEPFSGKSTVVLGLMHELRGKMERIGYFRPIIDDPIDDLQDNHIHTVNEFFKLELNYADTYAFTRSEVINLQNQGKELEIIEEVIEKYKNFEDQYDLVVVEGTDFSDEGSITEFDINITLAKNLGIPAILVASGRDKKEKELLAQLQLAYQNFVKKDVNVHAIFANKVAEDAYDSILKKMRKSFPAQVETFAIPMVKTLGAPTLKELADELGGKVLFGEAFLGNQAHGFAVGAMQLRNYLPKLVDNGLVITPGDRADIILGSLQANISANYPKISGIILTGGITPEPAIMRLIEGATEIIPIILVEMGTFEVANFIGSIKPKIYAENTRKINAAISVFEKYAKVDDFTDRLVTYQPKGMTPSMFQYNLIKSARGARKHIVLPESTDERILKATERLIHADVLDITLLGNPKEIQDKIRQLHLHIKPEKLNIIDPQESPYFEDYVTTFYELRKHKNITHQTAHDMMTDVSYFGTMMIYKGHADGMVSGAVHTTQHTIRPALQFIKTKPGMKIVSSVFFMCLEDRVSVFGDCAINPNPNAEELAEIAISSADSSAAFGIEPKVAMLSYSSGSSGKGADVEIVREATEIVKSTRPDLKVEGPIQYDAAVDKRVGKSKMPDSEVAGEASVLIFPDLNTGNNTYKAVQRETGAIAIGPMLQGLNKPVNDLSRGCTVEDVFNTVIITAIQAQNN
jgi:phosphate acetyltransferase